MLNLPNIKMGKGLWLLLQFTPCWFHANHRWQSHELLCCTAQDIGYGYRFTCFKLIKKEIQETCRHIHSHSNNVGVLKNGRFASGIDLNLPFEYLPFKCRACSLLHSCFVTVCQGQGSGSIPPLDIHSLRNPFPKSWKNFVVTCSYFLWCTHYSEFPSQKVSPWHGAGGAPGGRFRLPAAAEIVFHFLLRLHMSSN